MGILGRTAFPLCAIPASVDEFRSSNGTVAKYFLCIQTVINHKFAFIKKIRGNIYYHSLDCLFLFSLLLAKSVSIFLKKNKNSFLAVFNGCKTK